MHAEEKTSYAVDALQTLKDMVSTIEDEFDEEEMARIGLEWINEPINKIYESIDAVIMKLKADIKHGFDDDDNEDDNKE